MKKYLFCSFGNIAQREFRILKKLQLNCLVNVYTHKYEQHRIFDNELSITYSDNLSEIYNINNIFYNLNEALNAEKYDAVFIYTLPPERIDVAINVAERGLNFFVEKPLSNNLDKIYELRDIVEENQLKCAMGFQMRFHPNLLKLKNMVENNEFGDLYRIEVHHCNSIYNWTKNRDLKDFYALKEKNAGGILFSQIHEVDYLTWIFGQHYPISAIYGKWLDIQNSDVEDNITILSNLELTNVCIPVIMNLNFLSKTPIRKVTVYGTEKIETFDLMNTVDWNSLFLTEMRAFIDSLDGEWQYPLAKLDDGISSLEFVMDIKDRFIKI